MPGRARRGDPQTAARWLGLGAANLVRLLDIDRILLGGHRIFAAPDVYLRTVVDQIAEHLPDPAWQNVQVSLTPAGKDAVAVGAAQLVLDTMFAMPAMPATQISPLSGGRGLIGCSPCQWTTSKTFFWMPLL